ncbi:MAG: polyhydroxyalkanoate synthesis regulator DNA-binding domain-containing protein [Acidobacteriota bacterium]
MTTRTIKRYANRKLYDLSAKHYLTLDDLAALVEAGEQVRVIDKESGQDITSAVLSKIVSEMVSDSTDKEKAWLPAELLTQMIQKRSDAVVGYVKQGLAAGVRTVKDMEEQLQQSWKRVTERSRAANATEDLKVILNRMIEESLQFLIQKMNLPTRTEWNALQARLDEIERALASRRRVRPPRAKKRSRVS